MSNIVLNLFSPDVQNQMIDKIQGHSNILKRDIVLIKDNFKFFIYSLKKMRFSFFALLMMEILQYCKFKFLDKFP